MLKQAQTEFPLECCGLLAGTPLPDTGLVPVARVLGRYPLRNAAESGTLFQADPRSVKAALSDMDSRDWRLLGVYHSHPTSAPVPSKTDLELHFDPEVMALIISLAGAEPLMRAWWLHGDSFHEATWQVVA
jgi:proteasome lid subunit RPN8/RPN11